MDRASKLEALTGQEGVMQQENSAGTNWFPKANNIYEGSDSENDEVDMTSSAYVNNNTAGSTHSGNSNNGGVDTTKSFDLQLKQGQLAPEGVRFMSFKTTTKYPYMFVGVGNRQRVAGSFFDKNQIYGHTFDLFYLYPEKSPYSQPFILIPSKQFESLLTAINLKLKTKLEIPKKSAGDIFYIGFWADGNSQPRYLGRSSSREEFDALKASMPAYWVKLDSEPTSSQVPDRSALAEYKQKLVLLTANEKKSKATQKAKKQEDRAKRHDSWGNVMKRAQCYMGIRDERNFREVIKEQQEATGYQWIDVEATVAELDREATAKYGPELSFSSTTGMTFQPKNSVVFVSIDVEAYEFNHKQITEIGIATLDTLDISDQAAGAYGKNWMSAIRARHFRIQEHIHLINSVHVSSCAGSFEFGTSEFISIKDAPAAIASCFKHPFSGPDTPEDETKPKRNVVLVGHAVAGDVEYFKDLGYDLTNLSNLTDTIDTGDMWRFLKKEANPAKLAIILHELGITGWNLHNAGNDAVYTLQAMIGLAIKPILDKGRINLLGLNLGMSTMYSQAWDGVSELDRKAAVLATRSEKVHSEKPAAVAGLSSDSEENFDPTPAALPTISKKLQAEKRPVVAGWSSDSEENFDRIPAVLPTTSKKLPNDAKPAATQGWDSSDDEFHHWPARFSPISPSKKKTPSDGKPTEAHGWEKVDLKQEPYGSTGNFHTPMSRQKTPVMAQTPEGSMIPIVYNSGSGTRKDNEKTMLSPTHAPGRLLSPLSLGQEPGAGAGHGLATVPSSTASLLCDKASEAFDVSVIASRATALWEQSTIGDRSSLAGDDVAKY